MDLIYADEKKCVGCYSCVEICPIKDANIFQGKENKETCITCGACIKACSHQARSYLDDTKAFMQDLANGGDFILIVSPTIRTEFEDNWSHVLQWFRKSGVTYIMDEGYGADICTWAHQRLLEQNPSKKYISQQCPVIVNDILRYKQELIPMLSPIHSPISCMAVYLKKYLGLKGKIAALSPCVAKKDEFMQTGLLDYNVTLQKLKEYFKEKKIDFSKEKKIDLFQFDFEEGLTGSGCFMPGGLKENMYLTGSKSKVTSAKGLKVYEDLEGYMNRETRYIPQIFDVLHCDLGCHGGSGVDPDHSCFHINRIMHDVNRDGIKKRIENCTDTGKDRQFESFYKEFDIADFLRTYKPIHVKEKNVTMPHNRCQYAKNEWKDKQREVESLYQMVIQITEELEGFSDQIKKNSIGEGFTILISSIKELSDSTVIILESIQSDKGNVNDPLLSLNHTAMLFRKNVEKAISQLNNMKSNLAGSAEDEMKIYTTIDEVYQIADKILNLINNISKRLS